MKVFINTEYSIMQVGIVHIIIYIPRTTLSDSFSVKCYYSTIFTKN